MSTKPLIGVIMNKRVIDGAATYTLAAKYVLPIVDIMQASPVLLPPLVNDESIDTWINVLDGVILSGSYSDVHPSYYGQEITNPKSFFDHDRDATTFKLIERIMQEKMPLLGICRGCQEINVALGGTLHQSIHQNSDYLDHREVKGETDEESYMLRHEVICNEGGILSKIAPKPRYHVNSLHDQGIDRLAETLQIEAHAEDGLVEAFSLKNADDHFVLATQWHIEWKPENDQFSKAILQAFGQACLKYQQSKSAR